MHFFIFVLLVMA